MNILIVVTDQGMVKTYRQTLAVARHHELTFCSTRPGTLARARQNRYHAIIVHRHATDVTGPELVADLKMLPRPPDRIIGVINSLSELEDWKRSGADAILGPELDLFLLLKALGITFPAVPMSR